jgi:hypothetical protein
MFFGMVLLAIGLGGEQPKSPPQGDDLSVTQGRFQPRQSRKSTRTTSLIFAIDCSDHAAGAV